MTHIHGHSGRVNAVRFTPDGRYAVSAGDDHAICIHALRDGSLVRQLNGHSQPVYDVAVTPDSKYIVSGSADGTARVWQTATGREVTRLRGPDSAVSCVDISPDGRYIVAGTECLWVWCLPNFTLRHCLKPFWFMFVRAAAITPNSQSVMIGGERRIPIYTLDLSTGRTLEERTDAGKSADPLAISPDGRMAAAWTDGGGIEVWNRRSGQQLFQCEEYSSALAFTMNSNYLLSVDGSALTVYLADTGLEIARQTSARQPQCLAVSDDGRRIIIGNKDGSLALTNLTDIFMG